MASNIFFLAKALYLKLEEESWLDVYVDKLITKRVIGPILPYQ